jgi:NAD-dependent histone deacetylase SIR2
VKDYNITQVHGNLLTGECPKCHSKFPLEELKDCIEKDKILWCPMHKTNKPVKPNIVLYGEDVNPKFKDIIRKLHNYDCLLIMGTSLIVHPTASIINQVACDTYILNLKELPIERGVWHILGDLSDICSQLIEKLE